MLLSVQHSKRILFCFFTMFNEKCNIFELITVYVCSNKLLKNLFLYIMSSYGAAE